jgi:predicted transcriptional regulator
MPDDDAFARGTDPETSHEAAARVPVSDLEERVARIVRIYGPPRGLPMCVVEIHARLPELSIDTVSPRMIRLVEKGLLTCLGKQPRANRYGNIRSQLVYTAVIDAVETDEPVALVVGPAQKDMFR